jgi:predicted Zn-dependent protease
MSNEMSQRPHTGSDPQSAVAEALERAVQALRAGRATDAERLAAGVLKADRGNLLAAKVIGQALLSQGRPGEAIETLQRATRRAKDPDAETLLARALAAAGRDDDAFEVLRTAATRRPAFPLAFLELGDRLGKVGRFDEAVAAFEEGLALVPEAVILRVGLGYVHLMRNDRAAARRVFTEVRASDPQRRDAALGLAHVLAADGDYAAAADLYRHVLSPTPDDAATRIALAKCLLELGDRGAGEAALRAATRDGTQAVWEAINALAATPHGRLFLRPSDAARFLGGEPA